MPKWLKRQTAKDYKRFLFLFDMPACDKRAMVQKAKRSCCCINYTTLRSCREGGSRQQAAGGTCSAGSMGFRRGFLGFLGRSTRITRLPQAPPWNSQLFFTPSDSQPLQAIHAARLCSLPIKFIACRMSFVVNSHKIARDVELGPKPKNKSELQKNR